MDIRILALSRSEALSPKLVRSLKEVCGGFAGIWSLSHRELSAYTRHHRTRPFEGHGILQERAEALEKKCRALAISIATPGTEPYPHRLAEIYDLPLALYIAGTLPSHLHHPNRLNVAMVGTRYPDEDHALLARRAAHRCAEGGLHVISGLALGIDGASHRGALAGGGLTTAVVAGGVDNIYPASHRTLHHEILLTGGAVVSEQPPGEKALSFHFPRRNRIISALSDGVFMVQAAEKSGALITTAAALEQSRDILVADLGDPRPSTAGNARLLAQGAHPIRTPEDLLDFFKMPRPPQRAPFHFPEGPGPRQGRLLLETHEALRVRPRHLDELCDLLGAGAGEVAAILSALSLEGRIFEIPGARWALNP